MRISFIQEIIDLLRGKISAIEPIISKYLCYCCTKNFHTLAMGSSHMEYGYIPEENEINMGSAFQDIYYSYLLYKLLNKKDLKTILITYSVFSPGDFLIKAGGGRKNVHFI